MVDIVKVVHLRYLVPASILLASNVASADRIKVAVVPGIAVNLDAARVDALSQDLAEGLAADLDIDAVGGLEVRRQLPADGLPPDCVTTPACTADVAKRTGAQQLLFVVMVDSGAGGAVQVDTTWIDAATGKSASRPPIDLTSTVDADAKAKFEAAATRLLPDAPLRKKDTGTSTTTIINPTLVGGVPRHFTTPAIITGGATIVGLGVWAIFGLQARSKYNDCEAAARTGMCTQSQKDSISTFDHIADAGLAVGVIGAIATTVIYATSGKEPHVEVSPAAGGGATVSAFGRF